MAPEENLLCLLDYRSSGLGGLCKYQVDTLLLGHVMRQREACQPAVLCNIDARVGSEPLPREESDNRPARLEKRYLIAAYLGLRLPEPVSVEGDSALKVAHAECNEAYPWFHCIAPFSRSAALATVA
jgi:hypothetical protein